MTNHSKAVTREITNALLDLSPQSPGSSFACRLNVPSDSLSLEVSGVGKIRLPVTPNRAKTLIKVARQAPFGRREKTLTDPAVRDAWEIAKSRIKIDKRKWNQVLNPALQQIGQQLGLTEGELKADLYKMLVYQPGQFFMPHRDSEKDDSMLATLVVVLPCEHLGGALVIEHQESTKRFYSHRAASDKLSLFAFYADCRHELKPVTDGYRIALTYNVSYKPAVRKAQRKSAKVGTKRVNAQLQHTLGRCLSDPSHDKPLVVLLDHQYSHKSLRWSHLKNMDRVRAQALESALDAQYARTDYHLYLALVTLNETWHATDDRFDPDKRYRSGYDYYDDWDEDDESVEQDSEGDENLTLHELIEQYSELSDWRDRDGRRLPFVPLTMYDAPLVACTELDKLKPASSYYEDYTGNAGNTLDRTYRRAAIVIWSQRAHSGVLADMSLHLLFQYWLDTLKGKGPAEYEAALNSLDLEGRLRRCADDEVAFAALLELLGFCDDRELCIKTIKSFRIAVLTPALLQKFTQLASRYGNVFYTNVFAQWTSSEGKSYGWFEWVHNLQNFIGHCKANADPALRSASLMLFDRFTEECKRVVERAQSSGFYNFDDEEQHDNATGVALVEIFAAGILLGDAKRLRELQSYVLKHSEHYESADLVVVLEKLAPQRSAVKSFYSKLCKILEKRLQSEADSHVRASDDWRISHQISCGCELCSQLKSFLRNSKQQTLAIPAAKPKRLHLHRTINGNRLPVSHKTIRSGSPFTLNLVKRKLLFSQEEKMRQAKLQLLGRVRACM